MDIGLLLLGILPVVVFAVVDSFGSNRIALWSAIAMAGVELTYSLVTYHEIDSLTILSFLLVLVFALLSLKKNNDIFFRLQPALLGLFLATVCFVYFFILNKPILIAMTDKYLKVQFVENYLNAGDLIARMPEQDRQRLHRSIAERPLREILPTLPQGDMTLLLFDGLSRDLTWILLIHAALTAFAALKLSKWWWVSIRVPGFYLLLLLLFLFEKRLVFGYL